MGSYEKVKKMPPLLKTPTAVTWLKVHFMRFLGFTAATVFLTLKRSHLGQLIFSFHIPVFVAIKCV